MGGVDVADMEITRIVILFSKIIEIPDPIVKSQLLKKLNRLAGKVRRSHYAGLIFEIEMQKLEKMMEV